MAQTRVVLIGAGAVARRHAAVLGSFDDVVLAGVADVDPRAAEALGADAGVPVFDGVEALLDGAAPDAAYVCVPPFAHGDPERALIAAGLPFFVEKPLAASLDVAEELAAGVAERGLVTATGYHWRHLAGMERARALLADRPARLVTGSWLDKVPPPAWWCSAAKSGGQIVEQATHVLDCMLDLVGEVEQVFAAGGRTARDAYPDADVDAASTAVLRFAGGAVGSLAATSLLAGKHRASLECVSEGLWIEVAETHSAVDDGGGAVRHDEDPDAAKRRVDRAFVDAVQGRPGGVLASYDVALRTHRVACAIARSAVDGAPVDVTVAA